MRGLRLLYLQSASLEGDKPIMFYLRAEAEEEIAVKGFLHSLLKRDFEPLCIMFEIWDKIKG